MKILHFIILFVIIIRMKTANYYRLDCRFRRTYTIYESYYKTTAYFPTYATAFTK